LSQENPRRPALLVAAAGGALLAGVTTAVLGPTDDAKLFAAAGRRLWSRDGLNVFDDSILQTGPAHLLLAGVGAGLGAPIGLSGAVASTALLAAVVALLILALPMSRRARLGVLVACALAGPFSVAALDGHFEELLVGVTLLLAAASAGQGRATRTGALIGLAGAFKLWGVLGFPVVLLLPRLRQQTHAALVTLGVVVLAYAPFLAFGVVRTFNHEWHAGEPSPLALLLHNGASYGWPARLAQGVITVGVGAVIALRARQVPGSWPLVPAAVVSTRLLTDPDVLEYYWTAAALVALCVLWGQTRPPRAQLYGSVGVFGLLVVVMSVPGQWGSWVQLVTLVLALLGCAVSTRPGPDLPERRAPAAHEGRAR
jgi:hypothetical protein